MWFVLDIPYFYEIICTNMVHNLYIRRKMKKGYFIDGDIIKKLRKKNKWTQMELGTSVMKKKGQKEISFRTIQRIETESGYGCSKNVINSLAKVFGITVKDLLLPTTDEKTISFRDAIKDGDFFRGTAESLGSQWNIVFSDFQKKYNSLIFELEERQIRYIDRKLSGVNHQEILQILRESKFKRMNFESLIKLTNDMIKKDDFVLFCKAYYNYHSWPPDNKEMPHIDTKNSASLLDNNKYFFEKLEESNEYSIDYDVPDDEQTLENMVRLMEMIEHYFKNKLAQSEELRFRFDFSKVLKNLESSPFGVLFRTYEPEHEGWSDEYDTIWTKWRSSQIRILIKNKSNINFISHTKFCDTEYYKFRFVRSAYNPPYSHSEDTSQKEENAS